MNCMQLISKKNRSIKCRCGCRSSCVTSITNTMEKIMMNNKKVMHIGATTTQMEIKSPIQPKGHSFVEKLHFSELELWRAGLTLNLQVGKKNSNCTLVCKGISLRPHSSFFFENFVLGQISSSRPRPALVTKFLKKTSKCGT